MFIVMLPTWSYAANTSENEPVYLSNEAEYHGTKVIVWSHTGSAPDHAKITFIKADWYEVAVWDKLSSHTEVRNKLLPAQTVISSLYI